MHTNNDLPVLPFRMLVNELCAHFADADLEGRFGELDRLAAVSRDLGLDLSIELGLLKALDPDSARVGLYELAVQLQKSAS